ncbi:isochorismate synthase [Lentibacillus cibarius]|uniref:Isochorismate synthase MenF n=1 Tax=Lentibacillus cibarius TaxID=2583219 RepID=A0A5S3QHA7_9BACI|nr:isochorismate synthase [Lentibacillus cibarius]TMN21238.1 isochorismate synthase [Lentibacillus cibarius]
MIEVKLKSFESLLSKAITKAKTTEYNQLVSMTEEIHEVDPVRFFASAKTLSMDRVFWTSTSEQFSIVGVGCAWNIELEENRTETIENHWQQLVDEAIIDNPYQVPGTGVVGLGGMSFDPSVRKSSLWNKFSHRSFQVPNVLLTKHNARNYLTINLQVKANDDLQELTEWVEQAKDILVNSSERLPECAGIAGQQEIAPDKWKQTVKLAADKIKAHDAQKIVLARELRVTMTDDVQVASILRNLLETQPDSYVFAVERAGDCFVGASPERLVKQDNNQLFSVCLAGTAPRGKTEAEDREIGENLLHDDKNRSEHDFVVKMIRQSMEAYCDAVHVPETPVIHPFRNLQHLYTPVTAQLKRGYSIFDIIEKLHPTPALGGVPREASKDFIRKHEQLDRGWYGAPVGWFDSNRNGEFAVAIRSGLVQGDKVSLFAGCGVVKDSDPEAEYEETMIKFRPMLSALEGRQ